MMLTLTLLGTATDGRWRPGIGDPSWTGWITVVAYAIAACLAGLACRSCQSEARQLDSTRPHEARNERRLALFWLLASVTLAALGINKQLDLQSLFTQQLRDAAYVQGWYEQRRHYQLLFVVAIAGVGVLGVGGLAWVLRRVIDRVWMAVLGLGWLTSFVVIRAASFHHVDTFLRSVTQTGNTALELSGIVMVAAGAGRALGLKRGERARHPGDEIGHRAPVRSSDASRSGGMP